MTEATGAIIQLPGGFLALLVAVAATTWLLLALAVRRAGRKAAAGAAAERDWSVPQLDAAHLGDSTFHRWDARFKLVALLAFAFLVVATRSLAAAWGAVAIALLAVPVAGIPWHRPARRLLAMAGFLAMFVVIMPLTVPRQPTDTLVVFSGLEALAFNLRGLELALAICGKACAVALLMEPLLATAPLGVTVEAVSRLGVSPKVAQMILLAHRYIFVFLEETRRMAIGMKVRGFRKRTDLETLRVTGNFLGMLFVRSFERTHRVFDAMQARGYDGDFPAMTEFRAAPADWLKAALWLLFGLTLLLLDRLWLVHLHP